MNTWSGASHSAWQTTGGDRYLHYNIQAFELAMFVKYLGKENNQIASFLVKDALIIYNRSVAYIANSEENSRFKCLLFPFLFLKKLPNSTKGR